MKTLFHHIAIKTPKYQETIDFYGGIFGFLIGETFEIGDTGMRIQRLEKDNFTIEVIESMEHENESNDRFHLVFEVEDPESMARKMLELNIKMTEGPLRIGNELIYFFEDPNGIEVELNNRLRV